MTMKEKLQYEGFMQMNPKVKTPFFEAKAEVELVPQSLVSPEKEAVALVEVDIKEDPTIAKQDA